jgi:hypothetical protein
MFTFSYFVKKEKNKITKNIIDGIINNLILTGNINTEAGI